MRKRLFAVAACIVLLAAGCSKQQTAQEGTPPPANVTGLPLFPDAVVVGASEFHRVVDSSNQSRSLVALPKGSYTGHEIVASTKATQQDLIAWLQQVGAQPPAGLKRSDRAAGLKAGGETLQAAAHRYGIDFVAFIGENGDRGATIIVMDPKIVTTKLGPVLTVLARYNSMPPAFRQSMDTQIKQRMGVSISELTDRGAPLGAALAVINDFRDTDKRAIILLSAEKNK